MFNAPLASLSVALPRPPPSRSWRARWGSGAASAPTPTPTRDASLCAVAWTTSPSCTPPSRWSMRWGACASGRSQRRQRTRIRRVHLLQVRRARPRRAVQCPRSVLPLRVPKPTPAPAPPLSSACAMSACDHPDTHTVNDAEECKRCGARRMSEWGDEPRAAWAKAVKTKGGASCPLPANSGSGVPDAPAPDRREDSAPAPDALREASRTPLRKVARGCESVCAGPRALLGSASVVLAFSILRIRARAEAGRDGGGSATDQSGQASTRHNSRPSAVLDARGARSHRIESLLRTNRVTAGGYDAEAVVELQRCP